MHAAMQSAKQELAMIRKTVYRLAMFINDMPSEHISAWEESDV